jgi:hypothetical protein
VNGFSFILLLAAAPHAPVDFDTEVLPVLAKAGCNAGACHGAATGRGGFKLSLFGGDPGADHRAIVRELEGRRVNLAHPERSLLLLKPTWQLDHEGGLRFEAASAEAQLLTDWIAAGAPRQKSRQLVELTVEPANPAVESLPAKLALAVTARFDDGSSRRVEHLAIYTPADPAATKVDEHGNVEIVRPGRHAIVVRFLTQVVAIQVTAAYPAEPLNSASLARNNWIDDEINGTLAELRLAPAPRADDFTLLRRLTLDLTGRLPSPRLAREYRADLNPEKFAEELERLLASPEFTEYWTYKLADWLRVEGLSDVAGRQAYSTWLQEQVASGWPLNELAAELLTASGDSHAEGPPNFHRTAADARAEAEHVAETLLAVRLRCANCHNHPLDRWTQDDYHGLAAIFARLDRGQIVRVRSSGEVIHPVTGEPALPRIPGEYFLNREEDAREALANWLAAKGNRYFARAWVNRLWHSMFGRGLVDPIDDLRDTNPPTHPALLDRLAADFVENGYDIRHTLRLIAQSAAYQRASTPLSLWESEPAKRAGEGAVIRDDRFYSRALVRPIPMPILIRLICQVTEVPNERLQAVIAGQSSAEQMPAEPKSEPLSFTACAANRASRHGQGPPSLDDLAGQLQWLNGPLVNERLADSWSAFARRARIRAPNDRLVEEYYLRTLTRLPTAAEAKFWEAELTGFERIEKCQDFAWSLLSCPEFVTNH